MTAPKTTGSKTTAKSPDTVVVPVSELTTKLAGMINFSLAGPREFKTGSKGFNANGKVVTADGESWQCSVNVTLVNSKNDAASKVTAEVIDVAERVAMLVSLNASAKDFKTGSRGIFAQGKVTAGPDAQAFQVSAQAVHIRK